MGGVTGMAEHPTITVVVPTRNEADNVRPLVERITDAASSVVTEVVFVDDSSDDTPERVRDVARDSRLPVRLIHRPEGNRPGGLSGAVVAGMRAAVGNWICVMDGDLQHPPEVIPQLLARAAELEAELVVGTRYAGEGSADGLAMGRGVVSRGANWLAKRSFPGPLRAVSDPMSGFFLVCRDSLELAALKPDGFKILMEVVVRHPGMRIGEVPFEFAPRVAGEPKASPVVAAQYVRQLRTLRRASSQPPSHYYDIHGILSIHSEVPLKELQTFELRRRTRDADIRITVGSLGETNGRGIRFKREHVSYREALGWAGFAIDIQRSGSVIEIGCSKLLKRSPHVLYTNVLEPILRWRFVELGYALVHAACVDANGRAFAITARTDTGKTTTMLKLLQSSDLEFVSDDMTLVTEDGKVITYPKPLTISAHTLHAVSKNRLSTLQRGGLQIQSRLHSKSGRKAGFALTRVPLPVASMNAVVQRLIPPPKYRIGELIPGVHEPPHSTMTGLFIIQRGGTGDYALEPDEAIETLLENCEDAYGFPPYEDLEPFLRVRNGEDLKAREQEIIRKAFANTPALLLRSETLDWAERIPSVIAELCVAGAPVSANGHADLRIDLSDGADLDREPLASP